jgi:hypothetical protein
VRALRLSPFCEVNGILRNTSGNGQCAVAVKFIIYGESTGAPAVGGSAEYATRSARTLRSAAWSNEQRRNSGGPFKSGEPRWLEVQALLRREEPRVMLVTYRTHWRRRTRRPGGLPASAFAKAVPGSAALNPRSRGCSLNASALSASERVPSRIRLQGCPRAGAISPAGTPNTVPKFSASGVFEFADNRPERHRKHGKSLECLFADRFSRGVSAAIASCPANGCIIYAVSPNVNLNLGNIDPGFKAITIYLGPYTYTVKQVTLRKGLKIIGMGASGGVNGSVTCSTAAPCNGTTLQSVNGNSPVFVIPQTNNDPATNVVLSGFRLYGSVGNTSEDGFLLDTSSTANRLWS